MSRYDVNYMLGYDQYVQMGSLEVLYLGILRGINSAEKHDLLFGARNVNAYGNTGMTSLQMICSMTNMAWSCADSEQTVDGSLRAAAMLVLYGADLNSKDPVSFALILSENLPYLI
jgi:hypothetical protein